MKAKVLFLVLFLVSASVSGTYADHEPFVTGITNTDITAVCDAGDYVWVGSTEGLTRITKSTGAIELYNTDNSELPTNDVVAIAAGPDGAVWIGSMKGLTLFKDDINALVDAGVAYGDPRAQKLLKQLEKLTQEHVALIEGLKTARKEVTLSVLKKIRPMGGSLAAEKKLSKELQSALRRVKPSFSV